MDPPGELPKHLHSIRNNSKRVMQPPSRRRISSHGHYPRQVERHSQRVDTDEGKESLSTEQSRSKSENMSVCRDTEQFEHQDQKPHAKSSHTLGPPSVLRSSHGETLLSRHLETVHREQSAPAVVEIQHISKEHPGLPSFKDQVHDRSELAPSNQHRRGGSGGPSFKEQVLSVAEVAEVAGDLGPSFKGQVQSVAEERTTNNQSRDSRSGRKHMHSTTEGVTEAVNLQKIRQHKGPSFKDQVDGIAENRSRTEAVNLHDLRTGRPAARGPSYPRGIDPGVLRYKDQVMGEESVVAEELASTDVADSRLTAPRSPNLAHFRSATAPSLRSSESDAPFITASLIQPLERGSSIPSSMSIVDSIASNQDLPEEALMILVNQGFPIGLIREMQTMKDKFPLRFIIVDNSGSMLSNDSSKLVEHNDKLTMRSCSRWNELKSCIEIIGDLAGALSAKTIFRFLNDPLGSTPQEVTVTNAADASKLSHVLSQIQPEGGTPLTSHLLEICKRIQKKESVLRDCRQKVVVVIATDGIPTNDFGESPQSVRDDFVSALRSLQALPVWIVFRLCTNDKETIKYYRDLDKRLELPIECLDDFRHEAKEIYAVNKWLNYGYPLHLCREMGYHKRVFDLLDERTLNLEELQEFIHLIFGDALSPAPDIEDWEAYTIFLNRANSNERPQWNSISQKPAEWIDMRKLHDVYGDGFISSMRKRLSKSMSLRVSRNKGNFNR